MNVKIKRIEKQLFDYFNLHNFWLISATMFVLQQLSNYFSLV